MQLRRECEELYLSWWATAATSACRVRDIGFWGSLHHKRDAEAFDTSHLLRAKKKLRYCHCSFDAATTKNHPAPKDSVIRNTSVSELKFHPVKLKIDFISLSMFSDVKHPFQ